MFSTFQPPPGGFVPLALVRVLIPVVSLPVGLIQLPRARRRRFQALGFQGLWFMVLGFGFGFMV